MIVTSNTWSEELRKLDSGDRAWLVANSVHVLVNSNLWVDAAAEDIVPDAGGLDLGADPEDLIPPPEFLNHADAEDYDYDPWA